MCLERIYMEFLAKHAGWIITLIAGVVTWLWAIAIARHRLSVLEDKVKLLDMNGTTHAREQLIKINSDINHHAERMSSMETTSKELLKTVTDIDKNLQVVKSWIEEQRGKN
jgi:hypothetical protein